MEPEELNAKREAYLSAVRDLNEAQIYLDAHPGPPEVAAEAKARYRRAEGRMMLVERYAELVSSAAVAAITGSGIHGAEPHFEDGASPANFLKR